MAASRPAFERVVSAPKVTVPALRDDEDATLLALHALQVLDSEPEAEFDALVNAAALACGVPMSMLSLVDAQRQWFKAKVGLPGITETPREHAFCAHAVQGDTLMEVADATLDPRFADNPMVTGEPQIRFYAGAPLRLSDGSRVGTLCVIDRQARVLLPQQRALLQQLALVAVRALETRRSAATAQRAVQALMASEARFRSLSESGPLGVYAADSRGGCTYTNPRWQEIFGLSGDAALGHGWAQTLHPLDRERVFAAWQGAAQQRHDFDLEFRLLRADQRVCEVHSRARAVVSPSGLVLGYVGSVEDVTARKQLEAVLDRTGRLARVGGWEVDLRSQVLTWSQQTRRIHEVDDDFVPQVESAIHFYAEEARPIIAAAVQAGIEQGTPWDLELPLVTARGRPIWVRALGDVEFEDQRPVRLVGAFQDITEQRQRRQELLQEQSLRGKIEQQVRETERLLRERGEMLDVMAHEVRQPLNNASAALQSAVRALSGLSESSVTPPLMRAQMVLAQVLASMDNTLAVAALLARADPIERQYTDIDALVQVVVADLPQLERSRISVDRRTRTRTASMDMSLMRLALRNLLTNALKYSPGSSAVTLLISDSDDPLALLFDVVDQGGGIAADRLPRLFERNMHRGQPRRHAKQGLGLGLYIVKRVMELHGGSVSLRVNSPKGLTMRLVVNQPVGD